MADIFTKRIWQPCICQPNELKQEIKKKTGGAKQTSGEAMAHPAPHSESPLYGNPMGNVPWDGTGINCYGMGMGQINMSHGQPENAWKLKCSTVRVICTCDQCDSAFCALQLTALIEPNWCFLLYCCACLYPNTILLEAGWTTALCPATNLSILICKSFARTKRDAWLVLLSKHLYK